MNEMALQWAVSRNCRVETECVNYWIVMSWKLDSKSLSPSTESIPLVLSATLNFSTPSFSKTALHLQLWMKQIGERCEQHEPNTCSDYILELCCTARKHRRKKVSKAFIWLRIVFEDREIESRMTAQIGFALQLNYSSANFNCILASLLIAFFSQTEEKKSIAEAIESMTEHFKQ